MSSKKIVSRTQYYTYGKKTRCGSVNNIKIERGAEYNIITELCNGYILGTACECEFTISKDQVRSKMFVLI